MTTFAKATFDAAGYLASRPTYPARLYDVILAYHRASGGAFEHALDMGCGPGFMALALAPHFTRVSAQDPSSKMVSVGLQPASGPAIQYTVGSAEDMSSLPPSSVDLAVAGQAAHWFDHTRAWRELGRVLKPRGTVAYVGYGEMAFAAYPAATKLFREDLMHGDLGRYWAQPGRGIVEGLLDAVPFPVRPEGEMSEVLAQVPDLMEGGGTPLSDPVEEPTPVGEEGLWDPQTAVRIKRSSAGEWALRRRWSLKSLEDYVRTSSAYHAHAAANPEDKARRGGGAQGDVVERRIAQLEGALGAHGWDGGEVDVEWPLVVMMIKRAP